MADKPYTSNIQRLVDMVLRIASPTTMPETADAVAKKGSKRFISDPQDIPNEHPSNAREGSVESVIKALGARSGSLIDKDQPYLEQYLHPNVDILPKTSERPQTLPPYPGVDYRRPALTTFPEGYSYSNLAGLGNYDTENLPTHPKNTVLDPKEMAHDRWDFETNSPLSGVPGMDWLVKKVLQNSGVPYAVYGEKYPRVKK